MGTKGPRGVELLQGESIVLAASAARTAGASGSWIYVGGERLMYRVVLNITASATDAGDTLDVYVDVSDDGTNAIGNVIHFTQQAGNGAARREFGLITPSNSDVAVTNITSDAAAAAVRPGLFGPYIRARWAIVDGGGNGNQSHTFSVTAYAL